MNIKIVTGTRMKFRIETGTDNPILRTPSTEVLASEMRECLRLGDEMVRYLRDPANRGAGLAAPQVGINKRVIAVSLLDTWDDEGYRTISMVNPVIVESSESIVLDPEGCLSLPKMSGDVPRHAWVRVEFINRHGVRSVLRLQNLASCILQHEIDHLDGILFVDRVRTSIFEKHA